MKRKTEAQLEFPLLSIVYDPMSSKPVFINVFMDWGLSGEVDLVASDLTSLEDFNRVLEHAQNYVADCIVAAKKMNEQAEKEGKPRPF